MKAIARFFVDRPILAAVLSIVIFIIGLIAIPLMPISEYPEAIPPTVQVMATYPGANPKVISETVAVPLEEAINGVERMRYMKSVAASDGLLFVTITFEPGTDIDTAQVQVQNRVSQALPRLPEAVRQLGVNTKKVSPNMTMVVSLISPNQRYDELYLRNYAVLNIKDHLARLPGVGDVNIAGSGDYAMRLWLDPAQLSARGLTATDVIHAVREQNVQVSAGQIGAPPQPSETVRTLLINAKGRLTTEQEFREIIIKAGEEGETVTLGDVARVELDSSTYALRSMLTDERGTQGTIALLVSQAPGANALALATAVREKLDELSADFPEGVAYEVPYDTTVFVRESIKSVVTTLLEAVVLVVLVVILFLQTWRASLIPLIAVPVSIVGSFAILHLLGFSINTLTLFGLVLAIGIVVDDAIVVVENVERYIEQGLSPRAAAFRAMDEVSGPIVAIGLVLAAVFVPMCFLSGVIGQFYKQFAVSITVSTLISALNSLTLSPALAAILLPEHGAKPDRLTRGINRLFGWIFRPFNRFFLWISERYSRGVGGSIRRPIRMLAFYAILVGLTYGAFQSVPGGFIPEQDKLYLIGGVKAPEGASIDQTEKLMRQMDAIAMEVEGIASTNTIVGYNATQGINTPNYGTTFYILKPFSERTRSAKEIQEELAGRFHSIKEGMAYVIMPPPILGLGSGSGYSIYIQDRKNLGYGALQGAVNQLSGALQSKEGMSYPITAYQSNVPQIDAVVDRRRAKEQGVRLTDLFDTLQIYLGSSYINDFNLFGRTYQVTAQAAAEYRRDVATLGQLETRNQSGQMVPIGSLVNFEPSFGPDPVMRYNGYPAADLMGESNPRLLSSNQALEVVRETATQVLPKEMTFEWSDLTYEQANQGNASLIVFPLAVLLVFLVLAALYESWTLPLAVILILPLAMGSALFGVMFFGGDNNVFVQVGLVVLMGLACKNAILIVEFARDLEIQGTPTLQAAVEASRLRLRPIVMTSVAFIAGVVPLIFSSGAGAEVRSAMGIAVFAGMTGVTLFGLLLTPVLYVVLRRLGGKLAHH